MGSVGFGPSKKFKLVQRQREERLARKFESKIERTSEQHGNKGETGRQGGPIG